MRATGAGGKGAPERVSPSLPHLPPLLTPVQTFKIDRDAAIHFITAASTLPSITRFLLISYLGSRLSGASWWPSGEWDHYHETVNNGVLANYYKAKIAADEVLYETSAKSKTLVGINLRPGTLSDEKAGTVELGKTEHIKGQVSREAVAKVADALLASEGVKNTWLDLLDGNEEIQSAVDRVVKDGVDAAEGEKFYGA